MSGLVLSGVVVNKNGTTVRVRVTRSIMHAKYKKIIKRVKDYLVHDESEKCTVGEGVSVEACKPISRKKKWRVVLS